MRIVIITMGSSGDVNPLIAVAIALRDRGHDVRMLVNQAFADQPAREGIQGRGIGEDMAMEDLAENPEIVDPRKGPALLWERFIIPHIPHTVEALNETIDDFAPDVVVAHPISIAARWLCRKRGIPVALVNLSPIPWFSRYDNAVLRQWEPVRPPNWYVHLRLTIVRTILRFTLDRRLRPICREYGFEPEPQTVLRSMRDGDLNLALWSPHYRGPMPDDPHNSHICGFTWYDRHGTWERGREELEAFLNDGPPPVIFTLGSSCVHLAGDFYDHAAKACERLGQRGLLLIGTTGRAPASLSTGVRTVVYAPHSEIFPRGCVVVHHGGIGTMAQGLRAGRPAVVVPFSHDQFDNAARLQRLGVGTTVKRHRVSPATLAEAIRFVLDRPDMTARAADLGAALRREDGAATAAVHLEQFVQAASPERTRSPARDAAMLANTRP